MKPSDLRIGNFIYWDIPEKLNTPHEVVGIYKGKPQTIPISLGCSMADYSPIPLTEDWLLRFGFEQGGYDFMEFWIGDFSLMGGDIEPGDGAFAWNYYLYRTPAFGGYLHKQIEIKYVSQLQNLYFALTGEELNLQK